MEPLPTTEPLASTGSDNRYCELHVRWLSNVIELLCVAVDYDAYTGRYLRSELAREIADDVDEAIDTATDIQHVAFRHLDEVNGHGWTSAGFGEAVLSHFSAFAVAAE